ncbi:MAG: hypothetical protein MMC33_008951 [Icmadophila ericetorum]|nr:hypothetical protein [Icmadophila ericetorum]
MTTVQQQKPREAASSSGKDMLSRMLQREKLGKVGGFSIRERMCASEEGSMLLGLNPLQRRLSTIDTPSQLPDSPQLRHTKNQLPPRTSPSAHTAYRSFSLPRPHASPELRVDTNAAEPVAVEKSHEKESAVESDDSPHQEICRSPSWSKNDKAKRKEDKKRTEKEKELERRKRKEEESQIAKGGRTGKRLSKKPPAAMDTQRMPFSLRRSSQSSISSQEPSQERSSRSSRQERRSSITSLVSMIRFSRSSSRNRSGSPSPSPKHRKPQVVDGAIAQVGKIVGRDKRSSAESESTQSSKSSAGDKLYDKDLIQFAYQLQASTDATQNVSIKPLKEARKSTSPEPVITPVNSMERSAEKLVEKSIEMPTEKPVETLLEQPIKTPEVPLEVLDITNNEKIEKAKEKPVSKMPLRPILRNNGISDGGSTVKSPRSPNSVRLQLDDLPPTKKAVKDAVAEDLAKYRRASMLPAQRVNTGPIDRSREKTYSGPQPRSQQTPLKGPYGMPEEMRKSIEIRKSYDGSSYVHKERMYQQQRSIANYNAELAMEDTGEPTMKPESVQRRKESPLPAKSLKEPTQKNHKIQRPPAPERRDSSDDREFVKDMPKWYHKYLRDEPRSDDNKENKDNNQGPRKSSAQKAFDTSRDSDSSVSPTSEELIAGPEYNSGKLKDSSPSSSPTSRRLLRSSTLPFPIIEAKAPSSPKINLNDGSDFKLEVSVHSSSSTLESQRQLPPMATDSVASQQNFLQPPPLVRPKFSFEELDQSSLEPEAMFPKSSPSPIPAPVAQKSSLTLPHINSRPKFSFEDLNSSTESVLERRGNIMRSSTSPVLSTTARPTLSPMAAPPKFEKYVDAPKNHVYAGTAATSSGIKQSTKLPQGVVIEGVDGDGVVRKTSLRKPRSDPALILPLKPSKEANLNFLPELKHRPLTKPKRASINPLVLMDNGSAEKFDPYSQFPVSISRATLPTSVSSLQIVPKPLFASSNYTKSSSSGSVNRTSMAGASNLQLNGGPRMSSEALNPKPLAKMFVICCKCKYWHDLPSRLYEAMALPRKIDDKDGIPISVGAKRLSESEEEKAKGKAKTESVHGKVFTTVKCPWCDHGMSTACCAGWTAVVYLHEKHH